MKTITMTAILAALAMAGCFPEEKIVWSPDGQTAAIVAADGLRFCDAQGKLSTSAVSGVGAVGGLHLADGPGNLSAMAIAGVGAVAWFPDSRKLLAVQAVPAKTWEDLAWLDEPQRKQIIENADRVNKALLAFPGKELGKAFETVKGDFLGSQGGAILLYLRKQGDAELAKKYVAEWDKIRQSPVSYYCLTVCEVSGLEAKAGAVLVRSLAAMKNLTLSPNGEVAAYVSVENNRNKLTAMAIEGKTPAVVAGDVGQYCWTADGENLVYLHSNCKESRGQMQLGTLSSSRVLAKNLKDNFLTTSKPSDLAGVIFDEQSKVRCLRDGTILFAGLDARLPSTGKDMPKKPSLFSFKIGQEKSVVRVLDPATVEKMETALNWFVVSPNETFLAVPSISGKVTVVNLQCEMGRMVQPFEQENIRVNVLPSWRSAKELCIVTPPGALMGSPKRPEVVLLTLAADGTVSKSTILSKDWPDAVVASFVTESSAASQPATQPAEKAEKK